MPDHGVAVLIAWFAIAAMLCVLQFLRGVMLPPEPPMPPRRGADEEDRQR